MMSDSPENPECHVSANMLLEVAHRLFSYEKTPLALALIHVVLEQYPDHQRARTMFEIYTSDSSNQ